jgi:hypothetical protein
VAVQFCSYGSVARALDEAREYLSHNRGGWLVDLVILITVALAASRPAVLARLSSAAWVRTLTILRNSTDMIPDTRTCMPAVPKADI